jgi:hypothetical protein
MHIKINKNPNGTNFPTHVIWSKTRLGMQHIHLEQLWILTYAIIKKKKHISRINIYVNYKILINSPDLYLGIERQHAEVGQKILIIFIYKKHLGRFCINRKQFI